MMMKNAGEMLAAKPMKICTIHPDATVYDALRMMAERSVGLLVVMEDEELTGVISERDYARKIILTGRSSHTTKVREIMTTRVVTVKPSRSLDECMALMIRHMVRHLPVLEAGALLGVVSMRDVVRAVLAEKEFKIEQLEHYILGS